MSARLSSSLAIFLLTISLAPIAARSQPVLTVAAAADLTNLEPELAKAFEKTNPARVRFVTEASAILSQQIANGAPYDVFLSANAQFVDRLAATRKIEPTSVLTYAAGRLGMLWKDAKQHDLKDLGANWVRIVALPNPKLAPYGVAAQEALTHARVWEFVSQKRVYGENVRQTLQLFDSGNADAVITSDALLQGRNAQVIPAEWHQPIAQKAGIVAVTQNAASARAFLAFLTSKEGQAVFARFGFGPPTP